MKTGIVVGCEVVANCIRKAGDCEWELSGDCGQSRTGYFGKWG